MKHLLSQHRLFQIYLCIFLSFASNLSYGSPSSNNSASNIKNFTLTNISGDNQRFDLEKTKENTIKKTLIWFTKGDIDSNILADNFLFTSPYYKNEDKSAFLAKFRDSTDYKDKVLSKIKSFEPIITLKSADGNYFAIITQYHTYSGYSVYETILGKFNSAGLLVELRSIYDLDETKKAFGL